MPDRDYGQWSVEHEVKTGPLSLVSFEVAGQVRRDYKTRLHRFTVMREKHRFFLGDLGRQFWWSGVDVRLSVAGGFREVSSRYTRSVAVNVVESFRWFLRAKWRH